MKTFAILLVAGKSTRFENKVSKQVFLLKGKPVFTYPLDALLHNSSIDEVIVVTNPEIKSEIENYVGNNPNVKVCLGGETRQLSVRNGLAVLNAEENDVVLIHDGARPLLDDDIINRTIKAAKEFGAVTTSLPMEDTVAIQDFEEHIVGMTDRTSLVKIQTPQAFKFGIINEAHKLASDSTATDDCSLVMKMLIQVKLIPGSKKLAKLTTVDDINYLETYIKWQNTRLTTLLKAQS